MNIEGQPKEWYLNTRLKVGAVALGIGLFVGRGPLAVWLVDPPTNERMAQLEANAIASHEYPSATQFTETAADHELIEAQYISGGQVNNAEMAMALAGLTSLGIGAVAIGKSRRQSAA